MNNRYLLAAIFALVACKSIPARTNLPRGLAVSRSFLWPAAQAVVCFKTKGYKEEKEFIKAAVMREYNTKTAFSFLGFQDCDEQTKEKNRVEIEFKKNTIPKVTLGYPSGNRAVYHLFTFKFSPEKFAICRSCASKRMCMRNVCMNNVVLHEFGHILGLIHEQDRPDSTCDEHTGEKIPGARIIGEYDNKSIMNACNPYYHLQVLGLSVGDIATINKLYQLPQEELPPFADEDGDTIHNDLDRCPQTPADQTVWLIGSCQGCTESQLPILFATTGDSDQDLDGIPDSEDSCPETPPCAHIWQQGRFKGCTGGDVVGNTPKKS